MHFSKYNPSFETACLQLFESNIDPYFAEHERENFLKCLRDETEMEDYYVAINETGEAIACGGFVPIQEGSIVILSWGMVRRDLHSTGMGKTLLDYRLDLIQKKYPSSKIRIDTSQFTEPFFAKYGFVTTDRKQDGYGKGLDTITMELEQNNTAVANSSNHQ